MFSISIACFWCLLSNALLCFSNTALPPACLQLAKQLLVCGHLKAYICRLYMPCYCDINWLALLLMHRSCQMSLFILSQNGTGKSLQGLKLNMLTVHKILIFLKYLQEPPARVKGLIRKL